MLPMKNRVYADLEENSPDGDGSHVCLPIGVDPK